MQLTDQILFLLAGIGVINALLLAAYSVFVVGKRGYHNVLFGGLLLMLSLRIGKSILHFFADLDRWILQLGLSACILVGPLLYLYVKALIEQRSTATRKELAHLIIPAVGILIVGLAWPYESHPWAWNHRIIYGIYVVWTAYTTKSLFLISPILKNFVQGRKSSVLNQWALLLVGSLSLVCLAYCLALFGFPYLVGPLLFSLIFYVLFAFLILEKRSKIIFQTIKVARPLSAAKLSVSNIDPKSVNGSYPDAATRLASITQRMLTEKHYLDPSLKLNDLAQKMAMPPHELSRLINEELDVSFNQFVNRFRVETACRFLANSDHLTIEGIGYESGFASRSAFYRAFKLETGETPAAYKEGLKAGLDQI